MNQSNERAGDTSVMNTSQRVTLSTLNHQRKHGMLTKIDRKRGKHNIALDVGILPQ